MKPRLLVVGDSFHAEDQTPKYRNTHWSELLNSDFEVTNYAIPGASNTGILSQLLEGLKINPDYIFLGFTDCYRTDFSFAPGQDPFYKKLTYRWFTSCNKEYQTQEHKDCIEYYNKLAHTPAQDFAAMSVAAKALEIACENSKAIAWSRTIFQIPTKGVTYRMFYRTESKKFFDTYGDDVDQMFFDKYYALETETNLQNIWVKNFKNHDMLKLPTYHCPGQYQQDYAEEVKQRLLCQKY